MLAVKCFKFHVEFGIKLIVSEQIYVVPPTVVAEELTHHRGEHTKSKEVSVKFLV